MVNSHCLPSRRVAVVTGAAEYLPAESAPYHPSERYPEYPLDIQSNPSNAAYRMVRQVLVDLGLDRAHLGTPEWNPLGDLIPPGARVVVKPNWVLHKNLGPGGMDCMVTHPSILRAALDYVFLARPREVVLGDAPLQGCDFRALMSYGFDRVIDFFVDRGLPLRVTDFRRTILSEKGHLKYVSVNVKPLDQFVVVDLGRRSFLEPISSDAGKFRVTMYDPRLMASHHRPGTHRYCIAREVLDADLILNLPKLKTHKKAGLTAALKNLVGINGNKEYLPHHRKGAPVQGGDNYSPYSLTKTCAEQILDWANMHRNRPLFVHALFSLAYTLVKWDVWRGGSDDLEGSWHGNDTVWRMCLDLNRLLLYADAQGRIHEQPLRAELSIQDALIAGQGQGPLSPTPCPMGLVIAGCNPAAQDWVAALLMGLDPRRIPIISRAFEAGDLPLVAFSAPDIECVFNGTPLPVANIPEVRRVIPPIGWKAHIERASAAAA